MRILFISQELIGSGLCLRLVREGHDVKLFISDPFRKECLTGFVEKVDNWEAELAWVGKNGLIVFDDVGSGSIQNTLRERGFTVFGGNAQSDQLELDRAYAQRIMSEWGMTTLPSADFTSIESAIDFIKKNRGAWVVKQNSHISVLNYVGELESGKDTIAALRIIKKHGIQSVHLQKRAVGIEVGIARYFNGTTWVGPIEINHEHKRLKENDIGPLTAEMGTVMWHSDDEDLPLYRETLRKITPFLRSIDYRGDIDINCIVTKDSVVPLEFTPRVGTPSTQLHCELYHSSMADLLYAVAKGETTNVQYHHEYGVVVSIALPPFPYPPKRIRRKKSTILKIDETLTENEKKSIHFEEVSLRTNRQGKSETYWSGSFGYVAYVTARGETISIAHEKTKKIINGITLPKRILRKDIGNRVHEHDLPKLKEWGWV